MILFDRTLKPSIQDKILVSQENFVFTFRDGGIKVFNEFSVIYICKILNRRLVA